MSFYVGSHQKLWPRFSVGFPTSNDLDLGWIFYNKWSNPKKKKSFTGTSSCVVLVTLDSVKLRTRIRQLRTWGQVACSRFRASGRSLCRLWALWSLGCGSDPKMLEMPESGDNHQRDLHPGVETSPKERCILRMEKLEGQCHLSPLKLKF